MFKKKRKPIIPNKNFLIYISMCLFAIVMLFIFFTFNLPPKIKGLFISEPIVNITFPGVLMQESPKVEPPEYIRGIYITAYSAGRQDGWIDRLIVKMKKGRINAIVIDIKDYTGKILYDSKITWYEGQTIRPLIKDIQGVLEKFHDAGIYVIARQTVFQDPALVRADPSTALKTHNGNVWHDYSGLSWVDPQNQDVWDYNVAIATEAAQLGFDEINFDYMRFPSDGPMSSLNLHIPEGKMKKELMGEFYAYLSGQLSGLTNISIDMFGLVLKNAGRVYDLGIGQHLTEALDHFDYIYPMTYASHYPSGYLGLANPAAYPGIILKSDIKAGAPFFEGKRAKLGLWLQAFNLGAVYDERMMDEQIEVTEAATSTHGWLLWNARNYYPDHIFKK